MKTVTSEVIGLGDAPEYADFIDEISDQCAAFRASAEPPIEFARRLIGQFGSFADARLKRQKLAVK